MSDGEAKSYRDSGVDPNAASSGLGRLAHHIEQSFSLRDDLPTGRPLRGLGYYANILDIGGGQGLAICTDGVGTKIMVAEALGRYATIGIDCVAMNVNDLICVGADPIALVDYLAVGRVDGDVLDALGQGFLDAARRCRITIPGGEIAQMKEVLKGDGPTQGLDIVGSAVGLVPLDKALFGQGLTPGDLVVGVSSSGLHSNGYTLARKVLAPNPESYERHEVDLGRTLGEELLEPTALYVELARDFFALKSPPKALCHITGDGFVNLTRVESPVGFELSDLPEPNPVFQLIEAKGCISKAEMYSVYNMGVGLCAMVSPGEQDQIIKLARKHGFNAWVIGTLNDEDGVVRLPKHGLISENGSLRPV